MPQEKDPGRGTAKWHLTFSIRVFQKFYSAMKMLLPSTRMRISGFPRKVKGWRFPAQSSHHLLRRSSSSMVWKPWGLSSITMDHVLNDPHSMDNTPMKAIESTGDIDDQHRLQARVPEALPTGPVRLIVLLPDEDEAGGAWAQG